MACGSWFKQGPRGKVNWRVSIQVVENRGHVAERRQVWTLWLLGHKVSQPPEVARAKDSPYSHRGRNSISKETTTGEKRHQNTPSECHGKPGTQQEYQNLLTLSSGDFPSFMWVIREVGCKGQKPLTSFQLHPHLCVHTVRTKPHILQDIETSQQQYRSMYSHIHFKDKETKVQRSK